MSCSSAARPYSEPMTSASALDELRRCAGTQFDPQVVEAFCACVERLEGAGAGAR